MLLSVVVVVNVVFIVFSFTKKAKACIVELVTVECVVQLAIQMNALYAVHTNIHVPGVSYALIDSDYD